MKEELTFRLITDDFLNEIAILVNQLYPKMPIEDINNLQKDMFKMPNYYCFGAFLDQKLIGISSAWISVRFYSGKQLEVVNAIIDKSIQSKGYGKLLFSFIESWAKKEACKTIELNTYLENSRSHKFYFNLGYSIHGFHFIKKI